MPEMKISEVRCHVLQYESERAYTSARNWWHKTRTFTLVEVETDRGVVGWGEALGFPLVIQAIIEKHLRGLLIGQNPLQIDVLWEGMGRYLRDTEYCGLGSAAMSGVDIALWDLLGKTVGMPVYQLLGGAHREKVEAYATGLFFKSRDFPRIVQDGLEEVERYVKAGFTKVKMKIGLGIEKDLERISVMQKALGESAGLMVDANNSYDFNGALRIGRELEKQGILFFEAPIPISDVEGHRALADALDLPLADGETLSTVKEYNNLLERRAVDIIQPDLCFCGGLTAGSRIKVLGALHHTPILPHVWGSAVAMKATLHFLLTLPDWNSLFLGPQSPMFEYEQSGNPMQTELADPPLMVRDGFIAADSEPGLGITINKAVLERYRIR